MCCAPAAHCSCHSRPGRCPRSRDSVATIHVDVEILNVGVGTAEELQAAGIALDGGPQHHGAGTVAGLDEDGEFGRAAPVLKEGAGVGARHQSDAGGARLRALGELPERRLNAPERSCPARARVVIIAVHRVHVEIVPDGTADVVDQPAHGPSRVYLTESEKSAFGRRSQVHRPHRRAIGRQRHFVGEQRGPSVPQPGAGLEDQASGRRGPFQPGTGAGGQADSEGGNGGEIVAKARFIWS